MVPPQVEVLAHEAIGCFVTHYGFNYVIEAFSLGVPLVAMPRRPDQHTNAKLVEHAWKIGIRVRADDDGAVRREAMIEALGLGVPLVAMPRWTDQPTNTKLVEHVWKIGIRVHADDDGVVRREAMEKCIREVMERVEIKENAEKWRSLAKEAVDAGGSSDQNINQFVANFLCSVN